VNFPSFSLIILSALFAMIPSPARQDQPPDKQSQPEGQTKTEGDQAKKEKKVWTNDNLNNVKGNVSVVGAATKRSAPGKAANKADSAYIQNARKQLEQLNADLSDMDAQIAALRRFSEGESNGQADRQLHKSYNMQPIDQQIRTLEQKRKDTQSKIDQLLDEARKKGVQPGDLR
jgi:hypothetical protein